MPFNVITSKLKLTFITLAVAIGSMSASADCLYRGEAHVANDTITLFDESYNELSKDKQTVYANGAALILTCTPVVDIASLEDGKWTRTNIPTTRLEWVNSSL